MNQPPAPSLVSSTFFGGVRLPFMLLAAALPPLLAYNLTPSATLFNQLLALGAWGGLLLLGPVARAGRQAWMALTALAIVLLAALAAVRFHGLPLSLALSNVALLFGAGWVLATGSALGRHDASRWWAGFCWALLVSGLACLVISTIQVFAPSLADGTLIARSGIPGRAVGNMRQPNHLASLLMWACIAVVWLADAGRFRRAGDKLLPAMLFGFVFAIVLSASRTGMLGVALLALWGLLDRKLARPTRWSLMATPLMLAISWGLLSVWANQSGHAFGAESRLAEGAGSPSRMAILANTWALLKAHPWLGVGWGEFNLAWTMTPFPNRPTAFFDHCHNLPMQLLVELGLPLGGLVLALLGWSLWRAFMAGQRAPGAEGVRLRCAFMIVFTIGVHSLLEYPLWYAYFLLPAAFAFGLGLSGVETDEADAAAVPQPAARVLPWARWAGGLMVAASLFAAWDYMPVVAIYAPPVGAGPLETRIQRGQQGLLFTSQADYAAATSLGSGQAALEAARRTAHNLIDVRLMMAWARSLNATGDVDRARYVVQRLREFRSTQAQEWLDECNEPVASGAAKPFQCEPPSRVYSYQEMR